MTGITATSLLALRNQILQQNAALQKMAGTGPADPAAAVPAAPNPAPAAAPAVETASGSDFGETLKGALEQVNALQGQAETASTAYERGDTTDIASVMLSREKASVGFQATLQVRNKLLDAYKSIMNMPV